jgi:N-acetylglutamate synthase-like GNAT family acetyltransferase
MDIVRIRPAVSSEQKDLEALQWRASLSNLGDCDALLANPDAIELPIERIETGGVFVAEWNGMIAGFSAVLPRADGETELDALFVEPTIRRHGIGRLLVEHCVKVAHSQGSTALYVVGNPHAESFYLACGFEMTGMTETRFGAGLLLRKILASDLSGSGGVNRDSSG